MQLSEHEIRQTLRDRGLSPEVLNLIYLLETLVDARILLEFVDQTPVRDTIRQNKTIFPIQVQHKPIGQLTIDRKITSALKRSYIRSIIRNLERILEKNCVLKKYERMTNESVKERQFLFEIIPHIGRISDEREICSVMLSRLLLLMPVDRASIMLLTDKNRLKMMASKGIPKKYLPEYEAPVSGTIAGLVVETGDPILINSDADITQDVQSRMLSKNDTQEKGNHKSLSTPLLVAPITVSGKTLGVVNLAGMRIKKSFTDDDYNFLQAIMTPMGMAIENSRYLARVTEAQRVQRDLEVAAQIQRSLLPSRDLINDSLSITGICRPATEIGGDYYHYFERDGLVHLLVADVTGHGISSAILMTAFRSAFLSLVRKDMDPADMLQELNDNVFEDFVSRSSFVTCVYAQIEPQSGQVRFVNAGHNPPLHFQLEHRTVRELPGSSLPTGLMEHTTYQPIDLTLEKGDRLVLYTDGVTEAGDSGEPSYDLHALMRTLSDSLTADTDKEVCSKIIETARTHYSQGIPRDDMTLVILEKTD